MATETDCTIISLLASVALDSTGKHPKLLTEYLAHNPALEPFFDQFPADTHAFAAKADAHSYPLANRQILHDMLIAQYEGINISGVVKDNIAALLQPNTFTITTGHQLVLYTGPLYFIYKIASVIALSKAISEAHPHLKVVPVYWMATEDHDYEEIAEVSVFNRTFKWEQEERGPVGLYNPQTIASLLAEINGIPQTWADCYSNSSTLAEATRKLVHLLFSEYGVVVIDPNHHTAKNLLKPILLKEINEQFSFKAATSQTAALDAAGFGSQIFPRELNLFYMKKGMRERIIATENGFSVNHTDLVFTKAELIALIETEPELFSPNVVLRPLYQEILLPNLGYVGGPAEIAYWMQLGKVFDAVNMVMPLLVPRHFALLIQEKIWERWQKSHLGVGDFFHSEQELKAKLLADLDTDAPADWAGIAQKLQEAFDAAAEYAKKYDATLVGMAQAEHAKSVKGLENIEKRSAKAREQKFATEVNQVLKLQNKLFPNGGLQERSESILSFLPDTEMIIQCLVKQMQPLDYRFHIWKVQ